MKKRRLKLASKIPSIKDLDTLARKVVRLRDKKCCRCGKTEGKLEVAHFYSRAIKSTRWNLLNLRLLCFNCHYLWAHQNPFEFANWWQQTMAKEDFDRIRLQAHTSCKTDRSLEKIYLENELKKYEI